MISARGGAAAAAAALHLYGQSPCKDSASGGAGSGGVDEWREGRIEAGRKRETRGRRLLERRPRLLDFTAFG